MGCIGRKVNLFMMSLPWLGAGFLAIIIVFLLKYIKMI